MISRALKQCGMTDLKVGREPIQESQSRERVCIKVCIDSLVMIGCFTSNLTRSRIAIDRNPLVTLSMGYYTCPDR
jgi:hypothetical protein